MRTPSFLALALTFLMSGSTAHGAVCMIGVRPADGYATFVKQFSLPGGTTITGVEFLSNDENTIFPELLLLHADSTALSTGTVLRNVAEVTGIGGRVTLGFEAPVQVSESGQYYVALRMPKDSYKLGPGQGPGIGATTVSKPCGSFVAAGSEAELIPLLVDLEISLRTTTGPAKLSHDESDPEMGTAFRPYLDPGWPNPTVSGASVRFGLELDSDIELGIYDVSGRRVRTIHEGPLGRGVYVRDWDGRGNDGRAVAAGIYFARLRIGTGKILTEKLVLTR